MRNKRLNDDQQRAELEARVRNLEDENKLFKMAMVHSHRELEVLSALAASIAGPDLL